MQQRAALTLLQAWLDQLTLFMYTRFQVQHGQRLFTPVL